MALESFAKRETPVWRILEYIQRNGSATIKDLEQLLGITTTAVRQHLNTLQAEGYIEHRRVQSGVGRPHHTFFITQKMQSVFACHCDDLALTLLEEVFKMDGREKAALLLERVSGRLADNYTQSVHSPVLKERIEEFAMALNTRGILTDVEYAEDGDTIVLKTYNCPFHDLAQEHAEVCTMDQSMIEKVVGGDVNLTSSMMDGQGCCSFVVSKESAPSK